MSAGWRLVRAGTDAVPVSIRRFFETRRPARPRGPGARPLALAGAVVVVAMVAVWVVAGTSLFGVREVRITGAEIVTPVQVREAAAVPERTPLLRVPSGQVADRITAALTPVAQVEVSRDWPDTLVLAVTERTPVAAVPVEEEFRLVDAGGVAFHTVASAPPDLPLVVVAEPGRDDPDTRAALAVLAALTPALRDELATLAVTGPAGIELSLRSERTIRWGDATRSDDKARVATALLAHASDQGLAVIDVSSPEVVAMR